MVQKTCCRRGVTTEWLLTGRLQYEASYANRVLNLLSLAELPTWKASTLLHTRPPRLPARHFRQLA